MNEENHIKFLIKLILWPFKSYLRILVIVSIISLGILQAIKLDMISREIKILEVKRDQLLHENANLESKVDQMTNINRIEKLAREEYGLIYSGNPEAKMVIDKFEEENISESEEIKLAGVR